MVAPITGAWIETAIKSVMGAVVNVAPITGAWIETETYRAQLLVTIVAPITGAWIETSADDACIALGGRTHHGCVD